MKMLRLRWLCVVLGVLAGSALSLPAAAQWIWKDAQGRFNSSDRPPPPDVPERAIIQRGVLKPAPVAAPAASGAASEPGKPAVDKELEARRKQNEQQGQEARRRASDDRLAVARAENCDRARGYMKTLESGVRIARTNEKGEREFLGDDARQQEIERTRQVMASDCR